MRKPRMKDPSGIGDKLRQLIFAQGYTAITAAAALGTTSGYLYDVFLETAALSPALAAKLRRLGIDGRALYLEQASNKLARYEAKEAQIQAANERLCRAG